MNDFIISNEGALENVELETKLFINNQLFKKNIISDEINKKAT
jgi:hypothetical protein